MTRMVLGVILAATSLLTGCHTQQRVTEPTPVATTTVTVADTQGVIARYTNDIWPLIKASNQAPPDQLSQNAVGLSRVVYRDIPMESRARLEDSVERLGTVREADQTHGLIERDRAVGLTLADAALTVLDSSKATLQMCYTYIANSYGAIGDPPAKNPGASEATVELRKTDTWYLYAITNDHVVPSCQSDKA